MNCDEIESRILDYQEHRLSAGERAAVERHLASCTSCCAFARQLEQLDAALTQKVKTPALPPDFQARLHERIQSETIVLSEAQRAERKRQLQAEYEAFQTRLGRDHLDLPTFVGALRRVLPVGAAGCLVWWLMPELTAFLAQPQFGAWGQSPAVSLGILTLLLLAGVMAAFPREFRRALAVG
jgi:anti-sigma factor RsiW